MSCSKELPKNWVKESTPGCVRVYKKQEQSTLFESYKQHVRNPSVYNKPAWLTVLEQKQHQQQTHRPWGKRCCNDTSSENSDNNDYKDPQGRFTEWYDVDYIGVKLVKEFTAKEREAALLQPDDNQLLQEIDVMVKYIWLVQQWYFDVGFAEDIVLAGSNKYSDYDVGVVLQQLCSRAQNALQKKGYSKAAEQLGKKWYEFYEDGRVSRATMYNRFVDGVGAFVKFEEEPFTTDGTKRWSVVAKKFALLCSRTYTMYHKRHFDRRQAIKNNLKNFLTPDY